jgi:hypothetical protein
MALPVPPRARSNPCEDGTDIATSLIFGVLQPAQFHFGLISVSIRAGLLLTADYVWLLSGNKHQTAGKSRLTYQGLLRSPLLCGTPVWDHTPARVCLKELLPGGGPICPFVKRDLTLALRLYRDPTRQRRSGFVQAQQTDLP